MRIVSSTLAFAVIAAAGFLGIARAEDAPAAKEVTLKGTQQCAKCSLHEADKCQDVLTVKEGDKSVNYYLTKGDAVKHKCQGTTENVSVTGTVEEKDGKKWVKVSKLEAGAAAAPAEHKH